MEQIPSDIWIEIINHMAKIDTEIIKSLIKMMAINKYFYKILFDRTYKLATISSTKIKYELKSMHWLIPNIFKWTNTDLKLEVLIEYIKSDENLCIAGGYTTLMFLNKNLDDCPNSDVDVFIINRTAEPKVTFDLLCEFISENYLDVYFDQKGSVFNIKIPEINRTIQIIVSSFVSPTHVLISFDFSHNRSCYYLGQTYCLPDAIDALSKKTSYTVPNIKLHRLAKAKLLGLEISNMIVDDDLFNLDKKSNTQLEEFKLIKKYECTPMKLGIFNSDYDYDYDIVGIDKIEDLNLHNNLHFMNLNKTLINKTITKITHKVYNYCSEDSVLNRHLIFTNTIRDHCKITIIPFITLKGILRWNDYNYHFETTDIININKLVDIYNFINDQCFEFPKYKGSSCTVTANNRIKKLSDNMNHVKITKCKYINIITADTECEIKFIPVYIYYENNGTTYDDKTKVIDGLHVYYYLYDATYY